METLKLNFTRNYDFLLIFATKHCTVIFEMIRGRSDPATWYVNVQNEVKLTINLVNENIAHCTHDGRWTLNV